MPRYILAYHGGKNHESREAGTEGMARWKAWVSSLGNAAIDPGTPLGKSKTVSAQGVSESGRTSPLLGFSVVEAESLDAAVEMARRCPHLEIGNIEVAEMKEMRASPA